MLWPKIKQAWGIYRHAKALRDLLGSVGLWKYVILAGSCVAAYLTYFWTHLPNYLKIPLGIFVLTIVLAACGFGIILARIWREVPETAADYSPLLVPVRPLIAPSNLCGGEAAKLELSEYECHLEWTEPTFSGKLLFYVWNGTPNSKLCKISLARLKRWSAQQGTFIDDTAFGLMPFPILERVVKPEDKSPHDIIAIGQDRFTVLSVLRERALSRFQVGKWRLELSITLGDRRRRQNLDFEWDGTTFSTLRQPSVEESS